MMIKSVAVILLFICISNYCIGQNYSNKSDSIQITLYFKKHQLDNYKIPIFINKSFQYAYSLLNDTLRINIFPSLDTLYVKNDKYIYFDNICAKSKTQVMKIPIGYCENVRYLLIESKHMKTYLFIKKRKYRNHFILKCVY